MPNHYAPEVKVRLLESQSRSLADALQNSALGRLAGVLSSTDPTNADVAQTLLKGNTPADDVARHFDFVKRYHITRDPLVTSRKISEKRREADASAKTFQVIERAEVPEVKSGPSRGKISIIVTITVLFLAIVISFIMEYIERVKQDPIESEKLNEIKGIFRRSRRE